jgi:lysyl-tRNA synthetase class 2
MERTEQERVRIDKLEKLKAMGIDPYPAPLYPVTHTATNVLKDFTENSKVILAGRLMNIRDMGKATFAELQDSSGRIQLYFNRDEICPGDDKTLYNDVFKKLLDYGDFIGIEGVTFKTKVGEPSINVKIFTLLGKTLRPLPVVKTDEQGNVHDAFTDPELRYRMRYVDLVVNPEVKETFLKRTRMVTAIRNFLDNNGALEVDTPVLQSIPGGATARPFITHHNALNMPLYMRIANELYLKRLIVGGFDWVYEFSRNFRNEGMDRTHNPEFTILEFYVAYKDYFWMMETTEKLLETTALSVHGHTDVTVDGKTISFKAPYERIGILDAIEKFTGYNVSQMDEAALREVCAKLNIDVNPAMGAAKLIDEIFGACCEKHFIQPTFIIDYPVEMSPLTKKHRSKPGLVERFELIINGKEVANAYSELNDPIDQRERFEEQVKLQERGDDEAMFIDHDFLRALEYGMPPTSGIGIGIDRLAMLMTGQSTIQEVLFFPQMRPEKSEKKSVELNDNEKLIFTLLSKEESMLLDTLKNQAALSNKQWDTAIKSLRNHGLIQISKTDDVLTIQMIHA